MRQDCGGAAFDSPVALYSVWVALATLLLGCATAAILQPSRRLLYCIACHSLHGIDSSLPRAQAQSGRAHYAAKPHNCSPPLYPPTPGLVLHLHTFVN